MPLFQLPRREFAGFIFDCDGTLADSMQVHYEAWCAAFHDFHPGLSFPRDLYYSWAGLSTRGVVERVNAIHGLSLDPEQIATRKEDLYLEKLPAVQPIPEVATFARTIARTHPVSVATGAWRRVAGETLKWVGLGDVFSIIITPEDVVRGKPAPDMFLLAAERMGVAPQDCLVFEDGQPGIEGARAAGMEVVVIPTPWDGA
ncbi:MAG: HAD-IA family hydrolase [Candidatus Methylacidiphilales bacterium]|nr:HAD-IA family hydrolase [Candidatus Methylacidiphilales bacterium]